MISGFNCIDGYVCCNATANVDYRSSFADQGSQTSFFRIYIYNLHIYICTYTSCPFKRKTEGQAFFFKIRLPFAHHANGNLSFFLCPFVDEETNRSYPQALSSPSVCHLPSNSDYKFFKISTDETMCQLVCAELSTPLVSVKPVGCAYSTTLVHIGGCPTR